MAYRGLHHPLLLFCCHLRDGPFLSKLRQREPYKENYLGAQRLVAVASVIVSKQEAIVSSPHSIVSISCTTTAFSPPRLIAANIWMSNLAEISQTFFSLFLS